MIRYILLFVIAVALSFSVTTVVEATGFQQIPVLGLVTVAFAYLTSGVVVGALK